MAWVGVRHSAWSWALTRNSEPRKHHTAEQLVIRPSLQRHTWLNLFHSLSSLLFPIAILALPPIHWGWGLPHPLGARLSAQQSRATQGVTTNHGGKPEVWGLRFARRSESLSTKSFLQKNTPKSGLKKTTLQNERELRTLRLLHWNLYIYIYIFPIDLFIYMACSKSNQHSMYADNRNAHAKLVPLARGFSMAMPSGTIIWVLMCIFEQSRAEPGEELQLQIFLLSSLK